VKKHLRYDPKTGLFWRKIVYHKAEALKPAGWLSDKGYRFISVGGKDYLAHRLAWVIMKGRWPKNDIDHKNLNKDDNTWKNLRPATGTQNRRNVPIRRTNKSGYKGVFKNGTKWRAQCAGKHLGLFFSAIMAHAAYCAAAKKKFGEFARAH